MTELDFVSPVMTEQGCVPVDDKSTYGTCLGRR